MPRDDYEVVMGLEVHAELATKTKIFCSCPNEFGGDPNKHTCPVCMGMPGALPVLNEKVVEYAVKAGLATNCEISRDSKNDRKNYFYPDTPKAYQISQYDKPLCERGYVEIETEERLTIESVNDGIDYIEDEEAKEAFGIIEGSVEYDDVTEPTNLLSKGREYLVQNNKVLVKYSVTALDLSSDV